MRCARSTRRNRPRWTSRSRRISNACCSTPLDRDAAAVRRLMANLQQSGRFELGPAERDAIAADFDALRTGETGTSKEIADTWRASSYLLDPHSAVAVHAARKALARDRATPMIVLATAHPAKFPDAVARATGLTPATSGPSRRPFRSQGAYDDVAERPGDDRRLHARAGTRGRIRLTMSVEITTLPSGLRIVTDAMRDLETASLGVWIAAGSRHEAAQEHGLSHLARTYGLQGHAAAFGARHRRGDRDGRRRPQRGDERRTDGLLRARARRRHRPRARHSLRHPHRLRCSIRSSSNARRTSSCRRSAPSRTRPTISSSISSTRRPIPTSRSAGRSSARRKRWRVSTALRSPLTSTVTIALPSPSSQRRARSSTRASSKTRRGASAP